MLQLKFIALGAALICLVLDNATATDSLDNRVEELLSRLSLAEKVNQVGTNTSAIPSKGIPAYHWRNNILHGPVDNGVSTVFPQAIALAATWNKDLIFRSASIWAEEQRALYNANLKVTEDGLPETDMNFGLDLWGPNINMFVHPLWGRGQETYGEDPLLTGVLAAKVVQALQEEKDGVLKTIATPKHFDAYLTDKQPPRLLIHQSMDEALLKQYYFPAFRKVVQAGAQSIMCSYNGIRTVYDGVEMDTPMCMSPLLQQVLRDEMGFDGYVVSDTGAISFMVWQFHRFKEGYEASAAGINAGCDLNSGIQYQGNLLEAIQKGLVTEDKVDKSLRRLLKARIRLGLFDPVDTNPFKDIPASVLNSEDHRQVALKAAQESFVLLDNKDSILPLHVGPDAGVERVAIIGPAANDTFRLVSNYYGCSFGSWGPLLDSCEIQPPMAAIQEELQRRGVETVFEAGCEQESSDKSGFQAAVDAANNSDVVLAFMGLRNCYPGDFPSNCESEAHDRESLGLPGVQRELLQALKATGKKVILVLFAGAPVKLDWETSHLDAILLTWYGGTKGSQAIADVVLGKVAPSGKLPVTFPLNELQLADRFGTDLLDWPGRTYQFMYEKPLYTFGFGRSYTSFVYSNPVLKHTSLAPTFCVDVAVEDSNWSNKVDEIVMVFARYNGPAPIKYRPNKKLVGFTKVIGVRTEPTTACVEIDVDALKLVSTTDNKLKLQAGPYSLFIGGRPPGSLGVAVADQDFQDPFQATFHVGTQHFADLVSRT